MRFKILFIVLLPIFVNAIPPREYTEKYTAQILSAFEFQSVGKTFDAYHTFSDAYRFALNHAGSSSKLFPFEKLFLWYRKYGYHCGVLFTPSDCIDEYMPTENSIDREETVKEFLLGISELIQGIFFVEPHTENLSQEFILSGINHIYHSIRTVTEEEGKIRLEELRVIINKTKDL